MEAAADGVKDTLETEVPKGPLVYRQSIWTRLTHWLWAASLLFLLLSGLQIFNARPQLYIGHESGFTYDNTIFRIGAVNSPNGPRGFTEVFGKRFDTTGVLGWSGPPGQERQIAFPSWLTVPSYYDLGTARVIHFFFAWLLSVTLVVWLVAGLANGHLRRDLLPRTDDLRQLPRDVIEHAKFRFRRKRSYGPLQKLAYAGVLFVLLPDRKSVV